MHDVLVIGAGLTGLTAALTAAQAGLGVLVIGKGMGALHWSAGTIDVMGYTLGGERVEAPFAAIGQLRTPHPYARLDSTSIRASLAWFQAEALAGGVELTGAAEALPDANLWLPTAVGAKRPTYLAPSAQAPGDLGLDSPMVIVGLAGMREFYPELIAANLTKQGVIARAAAIPVDTITDRVDFNCVHLAHALDDEGTVRRLARELSSLVRDGERIGFPAIVGLDRHAESMAALREVVGAPIFEIPMLPPSVPGIRLHRALCARLADLNVRVETGMEVVNSHANDSEILWVENETSARPLRHRAERFVLATGGILGGGFTGDAQGVLREDVFDLSLSATGGRGKWVRPEFLDPRGQPIFDAGVEVDNDFRPVGEKGRLQFDNVWAGGGLLAHSDPIRERSLEGLAVATGRAAALALVSAAGVALATG